MAMVMEMVTPGGVKVQVFDDLYRDVSPEEMHRRRSAFYRAAAEMISARQQREGINKNGGEQLAGKERGRAAATDTATGGCPNHTHHTSNSGQSQGRQSAPTSPP